MTFAGHSHVALCVTEVASRQCLASRQSDNQETTPSDSSSSAPPPRKRPALLSYARPPVQSDTSADSPDTTLAAYITAVNQDNFNPDDTPNIYAERKLIALQPLNAKLLCVLATPRLPLWNVCFHRAVSSCAHIVQRWAMMYWKGWWTCVLMAIRRNISLTVYWNWVAWLELDLLWANTN